MGLYFLGLFGAAVCCLSMILSEAATPVAKEIPLEYGTLPLRRPPRFGFFDLIHFLAGAFVVGGVHLVLLRQIRLVWRHMEAVRVMLEEIETKLNEEAALLKTGKDLDLNESESIFEAELKKSDKFASMTQLFTSDVNCQSMEEDDLKTRQSVNG